MSILHKVWTAPRRIPSRQVCVGVRHAVMSPADKVKGQKFKRELGTRWLMSTLYEVWTGLSSHSQPASGREQLVHDLVLRCASMWARRWLMSTLHKVWAGWRSQTPTANGVRQILQSGQFSLTANASGRATLAAGSADRCRPSSGSNPRGLSLPHRAPLTSRILDCR